MKPDLNFEEAIYDEISGFKRMEQSLSPGVFLGVIGLIGVCGLIIFGKVVVLNLINGQFYQARSLSNINKEITLPASRGLIMDRYGEPLVKNIPAFNVVIYLPDLFKNKNQFKNQLAAIAGILKMPAVELITAIQNTDLEKTDELIIARNILLDQVIQLRSLKIDALRVKDDYRREYLDKYTFAHLLGYTGIAANGNSIVGKVGLEAYYDHLLRGVDGKQMKFRDVHGEILDEKLLQKTQSGYQLNTTIDTEFQKYFYQRFLEGLNSLNRTSGAGLALNPQTGEILALLSFPSYDNENPADFLQAKDNPLFNRIVSGVYSPGSVFKPFVALAALEEKIITPINEFYSQGYLELPNPFHPDQPSRFLDWKTHGYVNLFSALAKSSNVYFYIVGGGYGKTKGLGINKLLSYWEKFKLGAKTNIDLPSENSGFFYSPQEKEEKIGELWRIGDTYNASIGQGNVALNPLRLLSAFSLFAADGKIYRPYIAQSFIDERQNIVQINQPEIVADFSAMASNLHEVKKGLRDAVAQPYGTAHILNDLPLVVAGKTGSAQISNNTKTNAFFIGYAPVENPQIAILILVENAREGSINTLPIAYDVFRWYYYNRL